MYIFIGKSVDYISGPYYVTFSTGVVQESFIISIIDDNTLEETETLNLIINASALPINVTSGNIDQAVVTILDNDSKLCLHFNYIVWIHSMAFCVYFPHQLHSLSFLYRPLQI